MARAPQPNAEVRALTNEILFSAQPSVQQLSHLNLIGVKSVLNLRCDDEDGFISNESQILETAGIEYAQIPIRYLNDIDESNVDSIISKCQTLPKPCLVHCAVGLCACAAALVHVGKENKVGQQINRKQILEWGADLGHRFSEHPPFYMFLGRLFGE